MVILRKRVPGTTVASLGRFLKKAAREVGVRGTVNVLVTNSRELQALNAQFRHKDKPTDVLSFPPLWKLPEDFGGDIAISADIAARNAKMLRHKSSDEVKILILHGLLHLAGYDHERDNGVMAQKEQRLRRSLGLPTGLIERAKVASSSRTRAIRQP
jgi:probable rRNA maturation factor